MEFTDPSEYQDIDEGDTLIMESEPEALGAGGDITVNNATKRRTYRLCHHLSARQIAMVTAGRQIPQLRQQPEIPSGIT